MEGQEATQEQAASASAEQKPPRYLAIFKTSDGAMSYIEAETAQKLRKALAADGVETERLVRVWRGKPREIKTKVVASF